MANARISWVLIQNRCERTLIISYLAYLIWCVHIICGAPCNAAPVHIIIPYKLYPNTEYLYASIYMYGEHQRMWMICVAALLATRGAIILFRPGCGCLNHLRRKKERFLPQSWLFTGSTRTAFFLSFIRVWFSHAGTRIQIASNMSTVRVRARCQVSAAAISWRCWQHQLWSNESFISARPSICERICDLTSKVGL